MTDLSTLSFFLTSAFLLALAPGPDNLYTLFLGMTRGAKAAALFSLGLFTGVMGHTALIAFGVQELITGYPERLFFLQVAGALYLLYLAYGFYRERNAPIAPEADHSPHSLITLYGKGVVMNLSNPKVLLFFLAFLPQFIPHNTPSPSQATLLFGGLFIVASMPVFFGIAWGSEWVKRHLLAKPRLGRWIRLAGAGVLLSFALLLLAGGRHVA